MSVLQPSSLTALIYSVHVATKTSPTAFWSSEFGIWPLLFVCETRYDYI